MNKNRIALSLILCILYAGLYLYEIPQVIFGMEHLSNSIVSKEIQDFEYSIPLKSLGIIDMLSESQLPETITKKIEKIRVTGWLSINLKEEELFFQMRLIEELSMTELICIEGYSTEKMTYIKKGSTDSDTCFAVPINNQKFLKEVKAIIENYQEFVGDNKVLLIPDEKSRQSNFQIDQLELILDDYENLERVSLIGKIKERSFCIDLNPTKKAIVHGSFDIANALIIDVDAWDKIIERLLEQ